MAAPDPVDRARSEPLRRLVAEKLRILRLLRSLDRAAIDPSERPALHVPLVRLAEMDALLAALIEMMDQEEDGEGGLGDLVPGMLLVAEEVRGHVTDALDREDAAALRRAGGEVAASEAEVWMEVDGLRRAGMGRHMPRRPMTDEEAERAARRAWGRKTSPRVAGRSKVKEEERRELPGDDEPLAAWFERMPEPWREGVARIHDVPVDGEGRLSDRIAGRVSDGRWLARFLAERLGASERDRLAWLVAAGSMPRAKVRRALGSDLDVHWDWRQGLPPSSGGKLRAAGLVHVGRRGRVETAVVPAPLREPLRRALEAADPQAAAAPVRAARGVAARSVAGKPFGDPVLDHWKALDKGITAYFERWALADDRERARRAFDAVLAGGERVTRSEVEQSGLFEFLLFDWRGEPGGTTLAEERLVAERFSSDDERALARAVASALPRIYRVGEVRRGRDLDLVPVFPEAPPVVLTDRSISLVAESGWLLGARVYPAGPFFFVRLLGDPIPPERADRLLRRLRREREAFVRAGGADDPESFLRTQPEALIRALRAHRP